jgi:hypothetical protein
VEQGLSERPRIGRLRAALVVALALGAALFLWLADGSGGSKPPAATAQPRVLTASALRSLAGAGATPIYWAGPQPGARLELSTEPGGRAYLRYLTAGAGTGAPSADFLTIGTYPVPDPVAALRRLARPAGATLRRAPHGDLALIDPGRPTSVYLAHPGSAYEVEVYDPSPRRALAVALSGAVVPAG